MEETRISIEPGRTISRVSDSEFESEIVVTVDGITGRVRCKSHPDKEQKLVQNAETCLFAVCRPAAEQCAAVCRKGGGLVQPMEEMEAADREWTLGLYSQLLKTVERYCGCAERRRNGSCALTGLECEGVEET